MLQIGVQTKNIIYDSNPESGFVLLKKAGFSCADFSLNEYLMNSMLYRLQRNDFFSKTVSELENFFLPHKQGAKKTGITVNQMHMPYPTFVPGADGELNEYLWNEVAPKSLKVCAFFECPNIVIHGFKLTRNLGSEEAEWEQTEKFLDSLAPMAKEMGITLCIENLYNSVAGHLVEGPCCNARKAVERIDRFNDKYGVDVLGFCFDTGHANLVGIDFAEFITLLDKRLKVLHIHDNDNINDSHTLPFTFTKTRENTTLTDWNGFIEGLKKIKYDGVLSFETAPVLNAFPEEMKEETLCFLAGIGKYFSAKIVNDR